MRKFGPLNLTVAAAGVFVMSAGARADGPIVRHSADFLKFDGTEFATSLIPNRATGAGGALFFQKSVRVNADSNVLYVSMFGTGDAHMNSDGIGAKDFFTCRWAIGGGVPAFCRPSPAGSIDTAPSGWITLVAIPAGTGATNCNDGGGGDGDCHDNAFSYQWCVQLPVPRASNIFNVALKLGSSNGGIVFAEKLSVYIDSSRIDGVNKCTQKEPGAPTGVLEPDATWADTVTHQGGKK